MLRTNLGFCTPIIVCFWAKRRPHQKLLTSAALVHQNTRDLGQCDQQQCRTCQEVETASRETSTENSAAESAHTALWM